MLILTVAEVVITSQNDSVSAGSTVLLTCVGYGGELYTWITWRKDGIELVEDSRLSINSSLITEGEVSFVLSILEICSAGESDGGDYSCTADNGVGNDTTYFTLSVTSVGGNMTLLFPFGRQLIVSVCDLHIQPRS